MDMVERDEEHYNLSRTELNEPLDTVIFKQNDWTYLHLAAYLGKNKATAGLLRIGSDPNQQDAHGDTPLHLAKLQNNQMGYQILIDAGADSNIPNKEGKTPNEFQAYSQDLKEINYL